jgi:hypothetical protein
MVVLLFLSWYKKVKQKKSMLHESIFIVFWLKPPGFAHATALPAARPDTRTRLTHKLL